MSPISVAGARPMSSISPARADRGREISRAARRHRAEIAAAAPPPAERRRRARARSPRSTKALAARDRLGEAGARGRYGRRWRSTACSRCHAGSPRRPAARRSAGRSSAVTSQSTASAPSRWPPFISTARGRGRAARGPAPIIVGLARRLGRAEQRRGLGEVGREAIDQRQQLRPDRRDEARAGERDRRTRRPCTGS